MSTPPTSNVPARLLCVDDEPNILSALRRVFRGQPYVVETAASGAEALERLAQAPCDGVISDMRMPGMDGAELLERVRQRWPETVRILLTGFADITSTIAAINQGEIFRYLAKPWNEAELLHTVEQALARKRLADERDHLLQVTREQNLQLTRLNGELEARVAQRTEALARSNAQLHRAWLTSIKVFTGLMEVRSGGLAGHARRVGELARDIARQMALSDADVQDVFLAGLLHDVGKLGLPDAVLNQPLRHMSTTELAHYRQHAALGEQALMPLENLQAAARLVRSHHERWDGRGHPDGLHGEQIPLGARILALANDLDNLLHGRHTKQALSLAAARQQVIDLRDARYDPVVVQAWLSLGQAAATTIDQTVGVADLQPGDTLTEDWVNAEGMLMLAADRELDAKLIEQIQQYQTRVSQPIRLHVRHRPEPQ